MKTLSAVAIALVTLSCQPKEAVPPAAEAPAAEAPAPAEKPDPAQPNSFIGLTLEAAQAAADAAAVAHRVIEIDGEAQPSTSDFRPERLNFAVKNGIITAVTKG
jgi:hypothetical protein